MAEQHQPALHHEGWLEKLSPAQVKGWQKRWVVLHGSTLKYWKNDDAYRNEESPNGVIHSHTILSIDPHPDHALEFNIKVLRSRIDMRVFQWRIWCPETTIKGKKGKGKNSVTAEAWNLRILWLSVLDEWCERFLLERIFSRFHVRKPAKFLDEIMGFGGAEEDSDHEEHHGVAAAPTGRGRKGRPHGSDDEDDTKTTSKKRATEKMVSNLESYLDKRSPGLISLWQRRWFVFLEAEDMIVYYKSREEYLHGSEPVGSFQIADLNTVEGIGGLNGRELHIETMTAPDLKAVDKKGRAQSPDLDGRPSSPSRGALSEVNSPAPVVQPMKIRTYKLRALTTESRDQWVTQLKARINVKSKAAVLKRMQNALRSNSVVGLTTPVTPSSRNSAAGRATSPLLNERSPPKFQSRKMQMMMASAGPAAAGGGGGGRANAEEETTAAGAGGSKREDSNTPGERGPNSLVRSDSFSQAPSPSRTNMMMRNRADSLPSLVLDRETNETITTEEVKIDTR